jgi:hypothetical protein
VSAARSRYSDTANERRPPQLATELSVGAIWAEALSISKAQIEFDQNVHGHKRGQADEIISGR